MKRKTTFIKLLTMVLVSALIFHLPVNAKASDTQGTDKDLFAFYYSQLSKPAQDLYDQFYFDTYDESDPGTAYSLVTVDLDAITTEEIQECMDAYLKDNAFLKYVYDISELQIHDLNEYYENYLLISVPLTDKETPMIDILHDYLYFTDEVALYYSDDPYDAIKTLVLTTGDLVHAEILSKQDAFSFLEVGLEYMNIPAITVTPDSANEPVLIYVFLEDNWYAIDLLAELKEETNDDKVYLLGEEEAPTIDSSYAYPKLASTRYIHTYYEIEYSLEKRPCQADEVCEEVSLFHLYFYNTFSEPTTHFNIKNSSGQLVTFSTVHDLYVPLLDFPGYNVNTIVSYGETRDVISNYTGYVIHRGANTWWESFEVSGLTAYVHHENKVVTGYRYTRRITE